MKVKINDRGYEMRRCKMTTEQLTQEVMNLKEQQAKSQAEHEKFELILSEIQEEAKSTKSLAEDVHIMALNMQNMQKVQEETNRKVDALTSQEFVEYKENKKIVKQNVISKVTTSIITVVFGLITFLFGMYINSK